MTHEEKSDLIGELRRRLQYLEAALQRQDNAIIEKDAEIECLKAEWHAEIERSKTYARARDLIVEIRDAEISGLKALLTRAADALECFIDYPLPFVEELRKAAE
jgi:hypothetical protein